MITGAMLRDAMISAANNLSNQRQSIDALNVFPVPDGDTGTNMSMTFNAAKRELERLPDEIGVSQVASTAASALLRGARGNSGVIISLLFRGFAKGLTDKKQADCNDIAHAINMGVDSAYKAVMKPTEGTILTVARLAGVRAKEVGPTLTSFRALMDEVVKASEDALAQTPDLLPVLKKAGVVDAGGQGLVAVFEGMRHVAYNGTPIQTTDTKDEFERVTSAANAAAEFEGEITFTYCTEFLVNKKEGAGDPLKLRAYLDSIGDCVVVVDDDDIIKTHVHTDNPGNALQAALEYGQLVNIKIDNMRQQHENKKKEALHPVNTGFEYQPVDENTPVGFVAVAAGDGLRDLFLDLGVNNVVSGGQTMNPSTDDILGAIHATPASTVYVLPNNKNIIMAAEQAIKLADRKVIVIPTRTIPQGLSAMLAFEPEQSVEENQMNMIHAIDKVSTGLITFAARNSDFDGTKIKEGEVLALENSKLAFTEKEILKAVVKLTKSLVKRSTTSVLLIYGQEVSEEEAQQVEQAVREKLPDEIELTLISGGQPVYYYMISVE